MIVTDLEELGTWVIDHLPQNSDLSYESDWIDPEAEGDDEPAADSCRRLGLWRLPHGKSMGHAHPRCPNPP